MESVPDENQRKALCFPINESRSGRLDSPFEVEVRGFNPAVIIK